MVWRANFVEALRAVAEAGERLPVGASDPVLSGAAAVELYSGGLWSTPELEVTSPSPRLLIAELFAAGFRWSEGSDGEGRGLWHPELCTEVNVFAAENSLRHPERTNLLTIILDTVDDGRASCEKPRLHVVGIEDSVLQLVRDRLLHRESPAGPSATLRAITSLAMAGIGGPLRAGYLRRRLALETQGEFVFDPPAPDASEVFDPGPRLARLSEMATLIRRWRDQQGWLSIDSLAEWNSRKRLNRAIEDMPKPAPRYDLSGNNVVPFRFRSTPRTVEELR